MILLAGFFEGVGVILVAVLCIFDIKPVLEILLNGLSNSTSKTLVQRDRKVIRPDKRFVNEPLILPPQRKEVISEIKSVSLSKDWNYENSTDLTQIAVNSRTEMVNKERSQFESKLLESGISKETATKMALERFPMSSTVRKFGQSR